MSLKGILETLSPNRRLTIKSEQTLTTMHGDEEHDE